MPVLPRRAATQEVLAERSFRLKNGLEVDLVKEESYERMMALGLLSTPGIAIDGKVVLNGRIPKAEEVRHLLGIA